MPATFDYYPFDSGLGANSTEGRWRNMMNPMKSTGIIVQGTTMGNPGDDCAVSAGTGMTVNIDIGKAWIRGHMFEHSVAATSLAIASNSSGSTRTDLVVLRADFVGNTIQYQVLQGTTTPVQSSTVWDLPLATVAVPNGAASSASFTITDKRVFATPYGVVPTAKQGVSSQSLANNAYTALNVNSTIFWRTSDVMFPGADNTKIFAPQDGYYTVYARITFAANASGTLRRGIKIMANGTDTLAINQLYVSTVAVEMSCSGIGRLFQGDYVQVLGFQDTGSSMTVTNTELAVHFLSSQSVS